MVECRRHMSNNIKKLAIFVISLIGLAFVGANLAQAQYGPYEGVPPAAQVLVDKKIKDPSKKGDVYVDNLGVNDYHFSPGEDVYFKVIVKNTGNITFSKVEAKDILPQYVDYVLGSGGVRKDIRDITATYESLEPDESKEFEIRGRVFSANEIPNDKGLYCVLNKVEAVANSQTDSDTAQLCIEKKVLGIQPPAGANILPLGISFLGMSALGFVLKKKLEMVP